MPSYEQDRRWSDGYIEQMKQVIGPHLLDTSSFEQDAQQAMDLIVLRVKDKRIACRIRRPGYFRRYPNEFTVRLHRDSGAETEMSKIINGFGDWMLYAHASSNNPNDGFAGWMLIDLNAFRAQLIKYRKHIHPKQHSNHDGTGFLAFDVAQFQPEPPLLIGHCHVYPQALPTSGTGTACCL